MAVEFKNERTQPLQSLETPNIGVKGHIYKPPRTSPPEISPGTSGQTGQIPPAEGDANKLALISEQIAGDIASPTQNMSQIKNLMDAIKEIMPQGLGSDTEVLLLKLAKELEKTESNLQSISIQAETSRRKSDIGELNRKQEEAEVKRKKAAKKSGIAKLFAKIAAVIGIAVMVIGSVAASAATFGAASPSVAAVVLASAALASSAFLVANEVTTLATNQSLFKKMGMNDQTAMILMIGLSVLSAVGGAGGAYLAQRSSAKFAAKVAEQAAKVGVEKAASQGGTQAISTGAEKAATESSKSFSSMFAAGMGVTQSGIELTNASLSFVSAKGQVEVKRLNAELKEMEALLEGFREFLERGIKSMGDVEQMIQQLIEKAYENVKNKQQLITSIKLTA